MYIHSVVVEYWVYMSIYCPILIYIITDFLKQFDLLITEKGMLKSIMIVCFFF